MTVAYVSGASYEFPLIIHGSGEQLCASLMGVSVKRNV